MKKILKLSRVITFSLIILIAKKSYAQITQIVSLNTGVNSSNILLPFSSVDPKWQVKFPGNTSFQSTYVSNVSIWNSGYTNYTCSQWISPELNPGNNSAGTIISNITGPGIYQYRMSFSKMTPCNILSAKIVFSFTNADNEILNFSVNGGLFNFNYPVSPWTTLPNIAGGWIPIFGYTIPLNASTIVNGVNTIDFFVRNYNTGNVFTITGLKICAYLEIKYESALTANITGAANFCLGSPLTFNGTQGANATASNYQWSIQECTNTGIPINPGSLWTSPSYSGNPSIFTFPLLLPIQCGKYYLVKLNVGNNCYINSKTKIIFIKCPPIVKSPKNQTICKGSCTTLGSSQNSGYYYSNWSSFFDEPGTGSNLGTNSTISVCPNQTTNYSQVITDLSTGCSITNYVTITVENIDPNFSVNVLTTNSSYMQINATPNQLSGFPATFGYSWLIEELDASSNVVWSVSNPSCWWNFPTIINNNFSGILGLTQTFNSGSCLPSVGQFKYGTTYRITRGVWSANCPFKQSSILVSYRNYKLSVSNDNTAKDASYLMNNMASKTNQTNYMKLSTNENTVKVYPNPFTSIVNVDYTLPNNTIGKIIITDLLGCKMQSVDLTEANNINTFNLSSYQNGIYFVNVFVNNVLIKTEKIILSK